MNATVYKDFKLMEISKLRKLEEEYRNLANEYFRQAKEDEEFENGNQWTSDEVRTMKDRGQFPIVVNQIKPAVEQGVSMLTSKKPRFSATARDDSDNKIAKVFSDLMSYVWNISDGNRELKTAIKNYYIKGLGYLMTYVDPYADFGKGEVKIKSLDTFEVLVDPSSKQPDFSDASNIIISQVMTKEEIQFRYPDFADWDKAISEDEEDIATTMYNSGNLAINTFNATDTKRYKVVDAYRKIKHSAFKIFDPKNATERILDENQYQNYLQEVTYVLINSDDERTYISDPKGVMEVSQLFQQTGGVFHYELDQQSGQPTMVPGVENSQSIQGSTTTILESTIQEFIEAGVLQVLKVPVDRIERTLAIGWVKYFSTIINIDSYPIVPLINNHHRNPYPTSTVRDTRDIQRYINKLRSLIIAHASNSTNIKLLVPRGSTNRAELEIEFGKVGTGVIEFDAELGQPIFGTPLPLPNELYRNEADAKRDIEFLFGIFAVMHGDSANAPDTYKGTVAMEELGQRRMQSKQDDIESSLNQLAKVVVQYIQQVYTDSKVIRLLNPNNISTETAINQPLYDDITGNIIGKTNDITVGKYDVVLVSGSTLPSNRWARMEYYMSLYEKGIIDQVEVLKQTEVADTEGVLERHSIISQLQSQVQQLSEQVKSLTGDAQTKDREISHMQKRVELEKFKSDLSGMQATAEKATQIHSERLSDQLRMQEKENKIVKKQEASNAKK